jgi:DNA replication licensing factor MCM5
LLFFFSQKHPREKVNVGIRQPYFRVMGIQVNTEGVTGSTAQATISPSEEEDFRRLAGTSGSF